MPAVTTLLSHTPSDFTSYAATYDIATPRYAAGLTLIGLHAVTTGAVTGIAAPPMPHITLLLSPVMMLPHFRRHSYYIDHYADDYAMLSADIRATLPGYCRRLYATAPPPGAAFRQPITINTLSSLMLRWLAG